MNSEDRRSISGYCFILNKNGPLLSWKSRKQSVVALSSCEAEYIAITAAVQEYKFLSQPLSDLLINEIKCVDLYVDNQGAIQLARNSVHHQRSKHMDVKFHYIRSDIESKFLVLHHVPSIENCADVFNFNKWKVNFFLVVSFCYNDTLFFNIFGANFNSDWYSL